MYINIYSDISTWLKFDKKFSFLVSFPESNFISELMTGTGVKTITGTMFKKKRWCFQVTQKEIGKGELPCSVCSSDACHRRGPTRNSSLSLRLWESASCSFPGCVCRKLVSGAGLEYWSQALHLEWGCLNH